LAHGQRGGVRTTVRPSLVKEDGGGQRPILEVPGQVAALLGHPVPARVRGAACQVDPAHARLQEEEHEDGPQQGGLDDKEVVGEDLLLVVATG
jgi:hypothetical protein